MANYFPCPNAACTYQFDADQLPAAAMVTCPVCRTRFPYRAATTAPKAPTTRAPEEPAWHDRHEEVAEPAESRPRERINRLVNPRNIPKGNKTLAMLMLVLFAVVAAGALVIVVISMRKNPFGGKAASPNEFVNEEFNFRFVKFAKNDKKSWTDDESALKGRLGTNAFLLRRTDPEAWIGLRAWPIGGGKRSARPGELKKLMMTMLQKNFGGNTLEKTDRTISIAGEMREDSLEFKGELDGNPLWGEAIAFENKGIGYLFLIFSQLDHWPEARDEMVKLRNSFAFASSRDSWKPQEAEIKDHYVDGGNYQVSDPDAVWERAVPEAKDGEPEPKRGAYIRNPTNADPKATMLFLAKYPGRNPQRDRVPEADAMVLIFDKSEGEPLEMVKEYIRAKLQKDENEGVKIAFEPMPKTPSGTVAPSGEAGVGMYGTTNSADKTQRKFYAISAKEIDGKVVAVVSWCSRGDEDAMARFMLNLVSSLRERK